MCFVFLSSCVNAELNFDFGLNLFGKTDVRFDANASALINTQRLGKYINENGDNMLAQLQAINRWINLLRLADTTRTKQLIDFSDDFFSLDDRENASKAEWIKKIYYSGLMLARDTDPDPENKKNKQFETLLLEAEDILKDNVDYAIVKGLLFYFLRNRPNNYFKPMKPVEDFKTALLSLPEDAHYYYVLGQAFRMLGSKDELLFLSIASYERSYSLEPANHNLLRSLLSIYMGIHEEFKSRGRSRPFWLEEAVYRKILAVSPDNPYALNNLGYLYAEYGIHASLAQELTQRAVDLEPDNAGFRDSLGWAAFRNRDYEKAEKELLKSYNMAPHVYETLYHLGTLYYVTEEFDKAAQKYTKALKINPDAAPTLNNLAYLYAEQNINIEKALPMAEKAVEIEPNNASYIDTLGWIHYRLGNLEKALELLIQADRIAPGHGEITLHIGRVYLDMYEFEKALNYVFEAFRLEPDLRDPDNTLYLALKLRAYHNALADYHTILRERADKDVIISFLRGIASTYKSEGLFKNAIKITSLCADIKSGNVTLDSPVLPGYTWKDSKAEVPEGQLRISYKESEALLEKEQEREREREQDETEKLQKEDSDEEACKSYDLDEIVADVVISEKSPLFAVSFQPDFFRFVSEYVQGYKALRDLAVTVFVQDIFNSYKSAVIRFEHTNMSGKQLLVMIVNYIDQLIHVTVTKDGDFYEMNGNGLDLQAYVSGNKCYIAASLTSLDIIETLNKICRLQKHSFFAAAFNWDSLGALADIISYNPFYPLVRGTSRFFLTDKGISEYSVMTTGKEENDEFMKQLALKLFEKKLEFEKKHGLIVTIKLRADQEAIHISHDYENFNSYIKNRFGRYLYILNTFLINRINANICFLNRVLLANHSKCPEGATTFIEAEMGIVKCELHSIPALPFFLNERKACEYNRTRIQKILKDNIDKYYDLTKKQKQYLLNVIKKGYNVQTCPAGGECSISEEGRVNCTEH